MKTLKKMLPIVLLTFSMLLSSAGCSSAIRTSAAEPPKEDEAGDSAGDPADDSASVIDTILAVGTTQAFSDEPVPTEDVKAIVNAGLAAESAINQQPWVFVALADKEMMEELSASAKMPGSGNMPAPPQGGSPASGQAPGPQEGQDTADGQPSENAPDALRPGNVPESPSGSGPEGGMPPSGGSMPAGGSMPSGGSMPAGGSMPSGSAKASFGSSPLAIILYMDKSTASPNPDFDCGLAMQNMYIAASSLGYGVKIVSSPTMTLNGENHDDICAKLGVDPSLEAVAVLLVGKPDSSADGVSGATTRAGLEEKAVIIE